MKETRKCSKETRNKISNSLKGFKHSKETKNKMSKSHMGKVISLEQLEKRRKTMIGFKHSEETKKKISKSNQGREPWNKGKTNIYSNETIQSIKTTLKLSIKQYKEKYPTFSKIEEMRYESNKEKIIQVHCKNNLCPNSKEKGGWFTPTYIRFYERIRSIENPKGNQAGYFYCSDNCKNECPLYNKTINQLIKQDQINAGHIKEELYTSEEYQTWRTTVLERANYLCEYCEEPATDSHHSRPQKLEPGFVLDPDFGVACCEKCHYKYGHKDECSTGKLAAKICK